MVIPIFSNNLTIRIAVGSFFFSSISSSRDIQ
jgi:hypothetical protein